VFAWVSLDRDPPVYISWVAGVTGMHQLCFVVDMGSCLLFAWAGLKA
jgi:hypothetical protein